MKIQRGNLSQSTEIAELIFASEPTLLSFLFGGTKQCKAFLKQACNQDDGQFSAKYHWVCSKQGKDVDGICATWLALMPVEFQNGTVSALRDFLTAEQIIHLLAYKETLDTCFVPPTQYQLCIGHVAVADNSKRLGLASQLIQHALSEARNSALAEAILDVDVSNTNAIACYNKAGFVEVSKTTFEPTRQTFSRMILSL
jgi:ribosomal protein S18 acetylase RimI-like enzyme